MKKIFSMLLAVLMLAGCTVFTSSAADADMQFSTKGSTGKPDDLVTYEVYCDKSAGTYAASLEVFYDNMALSLVSFENGEVWSKSEYAESPLNQTQGGKGMFTYYAEAKDPDGRNENTGLMFKLTFQILKTAVNGDHEITLKFTDDGDGYFFYEVGVAKYVDLSVECTKQSAITVVGSDATVAPETNDNNVIPQTSDGETTKTPVTAYVTDNNGKLVKNEKGDYETFVVTGDGKGDPIPEYIFGENGEPVTDEDGNYVTTYNETTGSSETTGSAVSTDSNGNKIEPSPNTPAHRIILIASIAAVVIAAVIIIIVVTMSKKKNDTKPEQEEKSDKPEDNDNE